MAEISEGASWFLLKPGATCFIGTVNQSGTDMSFFTKSESFVVFFFVKAAGKSGCVCGASLRKRKIYTSEKK